MNDPEQWKEFYDAVYSQDYKPSGTIGSIQWQGTEVCMDVHCECGRDSHYDGEFAYYFECVGCGKKYAVGCNVKMIPLTDKQAAYAATRHDFFKDHQ